MERSVAQLKNYRSRFAWIFAISFVVLLVSNLFWFALPESGPPSETPLPQAEPSVSLPMLISVASLLTSVTSLIGFLFTTGVAWRKERREQQHADLDLERKKLEVEKLRLEIEGKKERSSPAAGGPSDVA
ncbi:MAG: hypothetical protein JNL68_15585 [Burkholderiales bacterium]|nr:hypothetical protein [Burkholderiales bacterium]